LKTGEYETPPHMAQPYLSYAYARTHLFFHNVSEWFMSWGYRLTHTKYVDLSTARVARTTSVLKLAGWPGWWSVDVTLNTEAAAATAAKDEGEGDNTGPDFLDLLEILDMSSVRSDTPDGTDNPHYRQYHNYHPDDPNCPDCPDCDFRAGIITSYDINHTTARTTSSSNSNSNSNSSGRQCGRTRGTVMLRSNRGDNAGVLQRVDPVATPTPPPTAGDRRGDNSTSIDNSTSSDNLLKLGKVRKVLLAYIAPHAPARASDRAHDVSAFFKTYLDAFDAKSGTHLVHAEVIALLHATKHIPRALYELDHVSKETAICVVLSDMTEHLFLHGDVVAW